MGGREGEGREEREREGGEGEGKREERGVEKGEGKGKWRGRTPHCFFDKSNTAFKVIEVGINRKDDATSY